MKSGFYYDNWFDDVVLIKKNYYLYFNITQNKWCDICFGRSYKNSKRFERIKGL